MFRINLVHFMIHCKFNYELSIVITNGITNKCMQMYFSHSDNFLTVWSLPSQYYTGCDMVVEVYSVMEQCDLKYSMLVQ